MDGKIALVVLPGVVLCDIINNISCKRYQCNWNSYLLCIYLVFPWVFRCTRRRVATIFSGEKRDHQTQSDCGCRRLGRHSKSAGNPVNKISVILVILIFCWRTRLPRSFLCTLRILDNEKYLNCLMLMKTNNCNQCLSLTLPHNYWCRGNKYRLTYKISFLTVFTFSLK